MGVCVCTNTCARSKRRCMYFLSCVFTHTHVCACARACVLATTSHAPPTFPPFPSLTFFISLSLSLCVCVSPGSGCTFCPSYNLPFLPLFPSLAPFTTDKTYSHAPMLSKTPSRSPLMFQRSRYRLPLLSAQDPVRSRNWSAPSEKVHPPQVHGRDSRK